MWIGRWFSVLKLYLPHAHLLSGSSHQLLQSVNGPCSGASKNRRCKPCGIMWFSNRCLSSGIRHTDALGPTSDDLLRTLNWWVNGKVCYWFTTVLLVVERSLLSQNPKAPPSPPRQDILRPRSPQEPGPGPPFLQPGDGSKLGSQTKKNFNDIMIHHDHWDDFTTYLPMKTHSHWATQAGYSEDAGAAPAALVQGMGMGCPFRNGPEIGMREKSSTTIVYCIQHFFSDVVFFYMSKHGGIEHHRSLWSLWSAKKMGGIRSTVIWIHSPLYSKNTETSPTCYDKNHPVLFWESHVLKLDLFWSLGYFSDQTR